MANRSSSSLLLAVGALLLAMVILQRAANVVSSPAAAPTALPVALATPAGVRLSSGIVTQEVQDPTLGAADAPRTLFLFTQWHCSSCRHFFEATLPQLKTNFIDTNHVRLVFKAFPIGEEGQDTEQAQRVAEAAYCAEAQQKFWDYTRHLFAVGARYEVADLAEYARLEGLPADAFMACLEGREYAEVVATNLRTAVAAGITATPAFVLDDTLYEGALSYAELETLLR